MPTPAITFGRMLGFLRFGPRSWGGDDSRQHPLTPPRVKLPSPPTPKQSQQRAERQLLALCWGLEGLIVVLVSQQAKTFPVLLFKLASFPHRTLPLSSGDRCDIPNRGRRIHQRQRSAGAAKWPERNVFEVCTMDQYFIPFYGRMIFQSTDLPPSVYPFLCDGHLDCFRLLPIVNRATACTCA
ncbi:uncharacterized protein LOC109279056 isoform X6 [Panthera pardus]|uniref:Uncharacterized protein LOC109279056 isoform X6 n=1 Tax=Panthera pardus TaxID=9691 RepID=A0A9W2V543_PANPR|nr:uncharacterized protein LOC109279056 isoform X6 [Panthera pardus]